MPTMHTPSPGLPDEALVSFEVALFLIGLLVVLLTFASSHGFVASLALQLFIGLAILSLTRGLPALLARRHQP